MSRSRVKVYRNKNLRPFAPDHFSRLYLVAAVPALAYSNHRRATSAGVQSRQMAAVTLRTADTRILLRLADIGHQEDSGR